MVNNTHRIDRVMYYSSRMTFPYIRYVLGILVGVFLILEPYRAQALPFQSLSIISATKKNTFQIEFANTERLRQHGLMFRTNLSEKAGMLFDFQENEIVHMWMKNTYLSLDIFFIDKNGIILHISENQEPLSLSPISSEFDVRAALELNAGSAQKFNIRVGDRVLHPIFDEKT